MADEQDTDEDQAGYGAWVLATREKKGWGRAKLADEAGISGPGLWNIEVGNTLNPNQKTRQKIEKALGSSPSKVLSAQIEEESVIEGIGSLVGFDPYDTPAIPTQGGVYVFYDSTQRPVYVGRSGNLSGRIKTHYDRFWFKRPIVESGAYIIIGEKKLRDQVEQVLIKFLRSHALLNKHLVDKDTEE